MTNGDIGHTTVGYQGVPGAYSEEALTSFIPGVQPAPYRTLPDLFAALHAGQIDRAFVPVENSHAGSVVEAYDLMLDHEVTVIAEFIHPVHHLLLGIEGAQTSEIERVYSHPQALAQTASFLRLAHLDSEPYYDTAGAAQMVAERKDRRYAAVASRLAGERYGLAVLAEGIQTSADNATRFFLLEPGVWERERTIRSESAGKTSLAFSVEHRPGALVRALSAFARQHVNLSRLESRPSRQRPWEYLFFTDAEGYADDASLRTALRELTRLNPFVRVLGSYPAAAQTRSADLQAS
jgi:prephenate dehydratase